MFMGKVLGLEAVAVVASRLMSTMYLIVVVRERVFDCNIGCDRLVDEDAMNGLTVSFMLAM